MKHVLILFLILPLIASSYEAPGQGSAKKLLIFKHQNGRRVKYLKNNGKLVYRLKSDGVKRKSKHVSVLENSLVIDNEEYALDEFSMMSGRSMGVKTANITGALLVVLGTGVSGGGYWLYRQGLEHDEFCEAFILAVGGIFATVVGGVVVVVGIVPLMIRNKRFDLEKKWSVEIGTEVASAYIKTSSPGLSHMTGSSC